MIYSKLYLLSQISITMYAIVAIAGQQFKVEAGKELFVNRLEGKEGDKVTFDKVLLAEKDGKTKLGEPTTGGEVSATILGHLKGEKVIVFKKGRRKGYKVKRGHRQALTKIKIDSIK